MQKQNIPTTRPPEIDPGIIPNECLLDVLREHPDFSGWKQSREYSRDPNDNARTLGLNGLQSFKGGPKRSLFDLAKERGLLDDARSRAGLPDFSQKERALRGKGSNKASPIPDNIFDEPSEGEDFSELFGHSAKSSTTVSSSRNPRGYNSDNVAQAKRLWAQPHNPTVEDVVKKYLSDRALTPECYQDLLGSSIHCVVDDSPSGKGTPALVLPMLTPDQMKQAGIGAPFAPVQKIHRVLIPKTGKPEKKQLGSSDDGIGRISYLPPFSANCESIKYLACEGLEDALSIRLNYQDHHFFVCQSKGNLKHVPEFLADKSEVLIISDHDGHDDPNQNGETESAKLRQELRRRGYDCKALMPSEPKCDANDALKAGKLEKWIGELVEVPDELVYEDTQFDIRVVVGDESPVLPRRILPSDLEQYLELVAESFDLNYESAFCELLGNFSFAVGGNKTLVIKEHWKEKALLWLASIGASGLGKTPLNRLCGGEQLEKQQRDWYQQYQIQRDHCKDQETPTAEKPKRKRWIASALTMERLCSLHEENPAGIGLLSDEIIGVFEGLNQYKGRGNDRHKLLSLWNGHSFDNPTAEEDRFIPSVFVPVIGGIQESLLSKIINDANTSDGLAARFLFNYLILKPEPASIERQREIEELISNSKGKQLLISLFDKIVEIRDQQHSVLISKAAKDLLQLYEHQLKREARQGSDQLSAAYGKLRTYVYRIALTLHYLTEKNPDRVDLSEQTALNTNTVMRFFVANMKKAYATVELTEKERKAKAILSKLRQLGGKAKHDQIRQPLKKTIKSSEATKLFEELIEWGVLREVTEGKSKFLEMVKK